MRLHMDISSRSESLFGSTASLSKFIAARYIASTSSRSRSSSWLRYPRRSKRHISCAASSRTFPSAAAGDADSTMRLRSSEADDRLSSGRSPLFSPTHPTMNAQTSAAHSSSTRTDRTANAV